MNEIILELVSLLAIPLTSWLTSLLMRAKSTQEVAKLKAEVAQMKADVRSRELDNDRKAIQTMMDLIVDPLRKEMESLRRKMDKLPHAIEKIPYCPHSASCPVSRELQRIAEPEPGEPGTGRGKGDAKGGRKPARGDILRESGDLGPGVDIVPEDGK